ncbi:Der GTPase-activating protein YihI [Thalassomonas actiniarum]|uniref:GTPase-activating protein n=1 Tax=Thalassomonas actiniarum TaxID=485447 RepID=A0AAE9YSE0_9GAMM|nr:Der GTPase-activating protein YihI [Thalassomonas actiniarum]WDD99419.1 GTPase-activating protein [Thalassomonas actiniarum]
MTRKRKSRKPGVGSIGIVKDDKTKTTPRSDKKPKKQTGNKPGNRQTEAKKKTKGSQGPGIKKDPRIGSKTPIALGKPAQPMTKQPKKAKVQASPIAAIRDVEPDTSLEQELYAIEEDAQLQSILEKQEEEIALSEAEVDYFNEKMTRHQQLRELLGWDDEDEESETGQKASSEDELWDKFDNSDLSEFE